MPNDDEMKVSFKVTKFGLNVLKNRYSKEL